MSLDLSPQFLILVPIVMGLVTLLKLYIPSRWAALAALVLGVVLTLIVVPGTFGEVLVGGITVGLTASGIYSGAKSLLTS